MADKKLVIAEKIEDIRQNISDSEMGTTEKNAMLDIVQVVEMVDDEVNDAHYRIDLRKAEYKELVDSITTLNNGLTNLSGMLQEYAKTNNGLLEQYNEKVMQIIKSDKKQNIFISISLLVLSMSSLTAFSGISLLKALWELIMKLPL